MKITLKARERAYSDVTGFSSMTTIWHLDRSISFSVSLYKNQFRVYSRAFSEKRRAGGHNMLLFPWDSHTFQSQISLELENNSHLVFKEEEGWKDTQETSKWCFSLHSYQFVPIFPKYTHSSSSSCRVSVWKPFWRFSNIRTFWKILKREQKFIRSPFKLASSTYSNQLNLSKLQQYNHKDS